MENTGEMVGLNRKNHKHNACRRPGTNRRPSACEADVIITILRKPTTIKSRLYCFVSNALLTINRYVDVGCTRAKGIRRITDVLTGVREHHLFNQQGGSMILHSTRQLVQAFLYPGDCNWRASVEVARDFSPCAQECLDSMFVGMT